MMESIENGNELYNLGKHLILSYKNPNISQLSKNTEFISSLENKLRSLVNICDARNNNALLFQNIIKNDNIKILTHKKGSTYWRQNIIVNTNRNKLLKHLKKYNIKASKYFPSIDRLFYKRDNISFEKSDYMTKHIINLWPGAQTTKKDIININNIINNYYTKYS